MRRRPSRRVLMISSAALFALALVIAMQPLASAGPRKDRWRWWWRPGGQATQPASPSPTATATATATTPAQPTPTDHSSHGSGTGQVGLRYDPAKIPAGHKGVGNRAIYETSESKQPDPDGIGAFRTVCEYSHMRPDDPIVKPGQPGASHLHTFWGNTLADGNSTAQSLLTSGNGTCRGGIVNRTAYWTPSVIDTRTGTPVAPDLIHVYYKSGYAGIKPAQIKPIPAGLRMIAGSATASGPQDFMDWGCSTGGGKFSTIPSCAPGDHVTMNVEFPQCWNGRDLDSADHKAHMAYPRDRACPASHPVALPVVSYHLLYRVTDATDTSAWRLSSDTYDSSKKGGYSLHGDWFGAWEQKLLEEWTKGCVQVVGSCGSHLLGNGWAMRGVPGESD